MNNWRIFIVCVLSLFFLSLHAQDIEVKKLKLLEKDQAAATSPRKDINGNACGLVKVALKEAGAEFEGNVMGDVQFTGSEYLVYLPNGTKRLGIKHPEYLPTTIVFADYGTKRVESSTTYELEVKTNKTKAKVDNSKKGMAVFNIKPSNAMLMIDGQIADGSSGAYTLSLPYGTHYYTVKLKDFSLNNQVVHVDKNAKTIDVDLTEFFVKVDVSCQTEDAEIFLNGEQKGFGKWKGIVAPGKCIIEAKKERYHTLTKTVELLDGDSIYVELPDMKAMTGTLRVENKLKGSEVFLNGEMIGTTPLLMEDLPVGDYKLELKHKNYKPFTKDISINEGQELLVQDELLPTVLGRLYQYAESGNTRAQIMLVYLYRYGIDEIERLVEEGIANAWGDDCFDDFNSVIKIQDLKGESEKINKDIQEEYRWTKRLSTENTEDCVKEWFLSECRHLMECFLIGNGFKQDFSESFCWAKIAAANDWVAWHYFHGRGVAKDVDQALTWLNMGKENSDNMYKVCTNEILKKEIIPYYQIRWTEKDNVDNAIISLINQDK